MLQAEWKFCILIKVSFLLFVYLKGGKRSFCSSCVGSIKPQRTYFLSSNSIFMMLFDACVWEHGFRKQNAPPGPSEANCLEKYTSASKMQLSVLFCTEHSFLSQGHGWSLWNMLTHFLQGECAQTNKILMSSLHLPFLSFLYPLGKRLTCIQISQYLKKK